MLLVWIYDERNEDSNNDDVYDMSKAKRYKLRLVGEGLEGEIQVSRACRKNRRVAALEMKIITNSLLQFYIGNI